MRQIHAERLTRQGFAAFGTIHRLVAAEPDGAGEDEIVRSSGDGWSDAFTRRTLISGNGSLGLTHGEGGDFETRRMERHLRTEEALFCAADPVVLAVAPRSDARAPDAHAVRAFLIEPGSVVVLHEGTWHDACRGVEAPAFYYWFATTGAGADWIDIAGGPVRVITRLAEHSDD